MAVYHVVGLMSGTSLDGLDIAYCMFDTLPSSPTFEIIKATTIPYPTSLMSRLKHARLASGLELVTLDAELGAFFGERVQHFIDENDIDRIDFIASHGHTIFHNPVGGFTTQIGHGAHIAAKTKLPVVCDFRSLDVALGGQGAPLVPLGDKSLFGQYSACLNLGGFANISFDATMTHRVAFDVCPVNFALNKLAALVQLEFDQNGAISSTGIVDEEILFQLNKLDFYTQDYPKSLGAEWFDSKYWPIILQAKLSVPDALATCVEHAAIQISKVINRYTLDRTLVTGGGAFNSYLIQRILFHCGPGHQLIIPNESLVKFKEALIFAWLGVLRWENKCNTLASVTGARYNSSSGVIYSFISEESV